MGDYDPALIESESDDKPSFKLAHFALVVLFALCSIAGSLYWKTYKQSALREDEADLTIQVIKTQNLLDQRKQNNESFDDFFKKMYSDSDIYADKPPAFYFLFAKVLESKLLPYNKLYFINLLGFFISVVMIYLIGARLFGSTAGLLSAAFWAFLPANIHFSRFIEHETLLAYYSTIVVYLFILLQRWKATISYILGALLILVGMYVKQTFILYPLGFLLYPFFVHVFYEQDVDLGPSSFKRMFKGKGLIATAGFLIILAGFLIIKSGQTAVGSTFFEQSANALVTAFVIVLLFELAYRKSAQGDHGLWMVGFVGFWALFNFLVLSARPHIFGNLLHAAPGRAGNLLGDQSLLFNMVFAFYFVFFATNFSDAPWFKRFVEGIGALFFRLFVRPSRRGVFSAGIQLTLFFGLILVLFLPFYNAYIDKELLRQAIERRGAQFFGHALYIPLYLLSTMSLLHIIALALGLKKLKWGVKEKTILFWLLLPLFGFAFVFFNYEEKYFFPALPALAVLAGRIIDNVKVEKARKWALGLFLVGSFHILPMMTVPQWFAPLPLRIFSLPAEHVRMGAEIATFSRENKSVEVASEIVDFVLSHPEIGTRYALGIDSSVLEATRFSEEYLNLLMMVKTEDKMNPGVFFEMEDGREETTFILKREGSRLGKNLFQTEQEVARFPIKVTRSFALLLSLAEKDWFKWKKHQSPNYLIVQTQ